MFITDMCGRSYFKVKDKQLAILDHQNHIIDVLAC